MHRIHKHGDDRCIDEYFPSQDLKFDCPKCDKEFSCNTQLQSHLSQKHEGFELSFPTMSLASEGSISDIYEKCQQCGKTFENELDPANHVERVHEYGETFDLYPCEECGYRGTDVTSIRRHIAENHEKNRTASESLKDLGIVKLPVVTKRRKQNFNDLVIDDNGDIQLEDVDDGEYFKSRDELLLVEEEDIPSKSLRQRKPVGKRKVDEQVQASKRQKMENSTTNLLQCLQCEVSFTRKDNLSRHIRNKH